jgi:hypothetical protein
MEAKINWQSFMRFFGLDKGPQASIYTRDKTKKQRAKANKGRKDKAVLRRRAANRIAAASRRRNRAA